MIDFINILLTIASTVAATFGIVLLYHGRKGEISFVYSINMLAILLWMWSIFFYREASVENVLFWTKLLYISASLIPSTFLYFIYFFPKREHGSMWSRFFGIFTTNALIILLISSTSNIVIKTTIPIVGENIIKFGNLYFLYVLYILGFFLYGFLKLFLKYRESNNETEKAQIVYLFIGYFTGANIAFVTNLIAPWFGYFELNWVGQMTGVLMVGFATYSIIKHRLFDVRVITTELLTFALWMFLLTRTLLAETLNEQLINGSVFLATFIFGIFLIRSVLSEVEQREEIERLAKDLEKANVRLKELDKLKSEFLSIASHQMRSPLTAIKGYGSLILEGSYGKIPEGAREAVDRIFKSTETMIKTVENFLNVSRIEQGRMQYDFKVADIRDLVSETVKELQPNADNQNIDISFDNDGKANYKGNIDSDKLKQVFVNLIDNAIKYTPKGGSIRVSIEKSMGSIMVRVLDTGVGMSPEDIAKIFKKFSRANDASRTNTKGTGLGLYVAKQMVEVHKGNIYAESKGKGNGSVFVVEIPQAL
jgi:signal transduction histidine kinase